MFLMRACIPMDKQGYHPLLPVLQFGEWVAYQFWIIRPDVVPEALLTVIEGP
jgi:hypothetical protein